MPVSTITPPAAISLFVKNIYVFDEAMNDKTVLRFFADGFAGLIFYACPGGMFVRPQNKLMPALFLHGQTITPIEVDMQGPYHIIAFQVYPFVLNRFFQVDPKQLNDDCYDLTQVQYGKSNLNGQIAASPNTDHQVTLMADWLHSLFVEHRNHLDHAISEAIQHIVNANGQVSIQDVAAAAHLTGRTFERRFLSTVGITAKQFAKIIQFQQSLEQLAGNDFEKLTDIVYANGFADHSHFVRVFKAFTGKTPSAFQAGY